MGMLDGKVAIVTGAGHGIGRGHAMELARHGASVVVNDLGGSVKGEGQGRDADLTVGIIEQRGGQAVANYEDVADYEGAQRMVAQAVETFGKLDVLVNNAGIVRDAVIWNMAEPDFDAVLRVHVKGTWAPCHWAARHWRDRSKAGETLHRPGDQHHLGSGPGGQLRADELRHRQGGHRRPHPDPQPGAVPGSASPSTAWARRPPPASPARCPTRRR